MSAVKQATDADFEQKVLKAGRPVLVDFYGTWCGPCKVLKPTLEEIASELEGKLDVVEVEVSDAPQAAETYGVMGVPTLVVVVGGETKDTIVGAVPKASIMNALAPHLNA